MVMNHDPVMDSVRQEPGIRYHHLGGLARTFCSRISSYTGWEPIHDKSNCSCDHMKKTLRSMYHQRPAASESKLLRCAGGYIFNWTIDIRPCSNTNKIPFGVTLTERVHMARFVTSYLNTGITPRRE